MGVSNGDISAFKQVITEQISQWIEQERIKTEWAIAKAEAVVTKAEATYAKAEATGLSLASYGSQFEYGLVKHEKALFDLNKIQENIEQAKRDREVDLRFVSVDARLKVAGQLRDVTDRRVDALVRTDTRLNTAIENEAIRRTSAATTLRQEFGTRLDARIRIDTQLRKVVDNRLAALTRADTALRQEIGRVQQRNTTTAEGIRRTLRFSEQQLRTQITGLRTDILHRLGRVAADAERCCKSVRIKTNDAERKANTALRQVGVLDRQVRTGMQRVRELEGSARGAGRSIQGLRNDLNALERDLRR